MTSKFCQLCESIPLHDLPPCPNESYSGTLSGKPNLHVMIHRDTLDDVPDPLGFHHHRDLQALRSASADGCELCGLIEQEADALLADIAQEALHYEKFPDIAARLDSDPSFDLWIIARPDGADGFWVVTKRVSVPDVLFILATFGFTSEDDDALSSTFRGRPVNGAPDQKVLDRLASWVTQCNEGHEECNNHDTFLPTRIIDVGVLNSGSTVRLAEIDEGTRGTYIALSYCWGEGIEHFTTNRDSLPARKAGIELSDLPQTFQDAIAMARLLGVPYIWIDSICICQDDLADWERESARMASVYSNAYLTISATGQPSSSGGLFFERPPKRHLRRPLTTTSGTEGHVLISPLHKAKEFVKSYRTEMRSEPLAERGWAFQERVLAHRVLHFASDQVSFECLEGSLYEDGLEFPDRYYSVYLKQSTEEIKHADREIHYSQPRAPHKPKDHWNALLWRYGTRKLTYPADKLPALAGVAKVYSKLLDDEYVAGLWRKTLVEDMCWQPLSCKAAEGPYRAPSWSWASVDGTPATGLRRDYELLADLIDYKVEIDGNNPFGRVKSGWVNIEAPLVPLTLSDKKGPTGHILLKAQGDEEGKYAMFDTIDRSYEKSADTVRAMEVFALVMAVNTIPEIDSEGSCYKIYHSLIVTPTGDSQSYSTTFTEMKRLGMMLQTFENFGQDQLKTSIATVKLV